jgi:hypothetical protein
MLRKVYGPITVHGVWRIRTNQDTEELKTTVADIRIRTLECFRYAIRMDKTKVKMMNF